MHFDQSDNPLNHLRRKIGTPLLDVKSQPVIVLLGLMSESQGGRETVNKFESIDKKIIQVLRLSGFGQDLLDSLF